MMNVSMLHLFSDPNGRIVYKPFDVFENYAKADKSDYVRFKK